MTYEKKIETKKKGMAYDRTSIVITSVNEDV